VKLTVSNAALTVSEPTNSFKVKNSIHSTHRLWLCVSCHSRNTQALFL